MSLMGYTEEDVEEMAKVLNYSIHHHIKETKFAEEDKQVLIKLADLLDGLLFEGRV